MAWGKKAGKRVPTHVRVKILARDGHQCQECGGSGGELEVDHRDNTRGPGYDLESNLQTLCVGCHARKTQREALAGRRRFYGRGRHPTETHPGLG